MDILQGSSNGQSKTSNKILTCSFWVNFVIIPYTMFSIILTKRLLKPLWIFIALSYFLKGGCVIYGFQQIEILKAFFWRCRQWQSGFPQFINAHFPQHRLFGCGVNKIFLRKVWRLMFFNRSRFCRFFWKY